MASTSCSDSLSSSSSSSSSSAEGKFKVIYLGSKPISRTRPKRHEGDPDKPQKRTTKRQLTSIRFTPSQIERYLDHMYADSRAQQRSTRYQQIRKTLFDVLALRAEKKVTCPVIHRMGETLDRLSATFGEDSLAVDHIVSSSLFLALLIWKPKGHQESHSPLVTYHNFYSFLNSLCNLQIIPKQDNSTKCDTEARVIAQIKKNCDPDFDDPATRRLFLKYLLPYRDVIKWKSSRKGQNLMERYAEMLTKSLTSAEEQQLNEATALVQNQPQCDNPLCACKHISSFGTRLYAKLATVIGFPTQQPVECPGSFKLESLYFETEIEGTWEKKPTRTDMVFKAMSITSKEVDYDEKIPPFSLVKAIKKNEIHL